MIVEIMILGVWLMSIWGIAVAWIIAIRKPHTRFSRFWFGRKWTVRFAPARQAATRSVGFWLAATWFWAGISPLCLILAAMYPTMREARNIGFALSLVLMVCCFCIAMFYAIRDAQQNKSTRDA